jgi:hypothetical protein
VKDFGVNDDVTVAYKEIITSIIFQIPILKCQKRLNPERRESSVKRFSEVPAKWTGNGSKKIKPDKNDWYETVKVNYGVRPDGSKIFRSFLMIKSAASHFEFWKGKDVPDSWKKFRILHCFGLLKVDGFRYDMAEMVPYEFWSYMNSAIKMQNRCFFAEVYNTKEYRNYIRLGKWIICMIRWRPMIN